jgi:hypothetical protein
MLTFIQAIGRQEGVLIPGSLANRRNNPGNIIEGEWAQANGALPPDGNRFAVWASLEAGYDAVRTLLREHYLGMTVAAALDRWAPPEDGNNQSAYLGNVTEWTGMGADEVLTESNIG